MKIHLCSEVIRELDFAGQCAFARAVGYDGLEIAPFTLAEDPARLTSRELQALRSIASDEGVEISGLHWLMASPEGLSITSLDRDVQRRTAAFGRRLTEICAELGGRYLVHGSPHQRRLDDDDPEASRRAGIAYFDMAGRAARENGVTYIIEPLSRLDTGFVNEVGEARQIIAELGHDSLATMIDCYAAAANGDDPADRIAREAAQGELFHIHLNDDNKRGPGQGGTDFAAVVAALRKAAYAGDVAIEPFDYHPDGQSCAARSLGYVRGLLDRMRT